MLGAAASLPAPPAQTALHYPGAPTNPQAHLPSIKDKVLRKHTIIDNVNGVLKVGRLGAGEQQCAGCGCSACHAI